jgi:hypothetical protein
VRKVDAEKSELAIVENRRQDAFTAWVRGLPRQREAEMRWAIENCPVLKSVGMELVIEGEESTHRPTTEKDPRHGPAAEGSGLGPDVERKA